MSKLSQNYPNPWDGKLVATKNGGNSWDLVTNYAEPEYQYIEKFCFLDDSLGYLKCRRGIYKTLSGGISWDLIKLESDSWADNIGDFYFCNSKLGFLEINGNRYISHFEVTLNGGIDWISKESPCSGCIDFCMTPDSTIWLSDYDSKLYKSAALDTIWIEYQNHLSSLNNKRIFRIKFFDKKMGYLFANNDSSLSVYKTIDGASSWQKITEFQSSGNNIYTKFFSIDSFIIANNNWIRITDNGGNNYELITIPNSVYISELSFINRNAAFSRNSGNNLIKTTNSGETWSYIAGPALQNIDQAQFFSDGSSYIQSYCLQDNYNDFYNVFKSEDYGSTWNSIIKEDNINNPEFYFAEFISKNIGFAFGKNLDIDNLDFGYHRSDDGGITWNLLYTINTDLFHGHDSLKSDNRSYFILDENHSWLTFWTKNPSGKYDQLLMSTIDGGHSWKEITLYNDIEEYNEFGGPSKIISLFFTSPQNGWYTDYNANVYSSSDSGKTWEKSSISFNHAYNCGIDFYNENIGCIYGEEKIFTTKDGGENWNELQPWEEGGAWGVKYISENVAYMSKHSGIMMTADGGDSWQMVKSFDTDIGWANSLNYNPLFYSSNEVLWFVGNNGLIMKNDNPLTTVSQHAEITNNFSLSQNYPNPFNPTTTIKYQIPAVVDANFASTKKVSLIVYDILGREVASLVNQKQKPGNYEVKWNAVNQPSGVYFYKLQASEYTKTKKMILLR